MSLNYSVLRYKNGNKLIDVSAICQLLSRLIQIKPSLEHKKLKLGLFHQVPLNMFIHKQSLDDIQK